MLRSMPGWQGVNMRRLFGFALGSGVVLGLLLTVLDHDHSHQTAKAPVKSAVALAVPQAPVQGATGRTGVRNTTLPNPTGGESPAGPGTLRMQPDKADEPEILRLSRVVVTDRGRLQAEQEKLVIRLHGVSMPERAWNCKLPSGQTWPCGEHAAAALSSQIGRA